MVSIDSRKLSIRERQGKDMGNLYDVFNKVEEGTSNSEKWKEEQKANREYCFRTIEAGLPEVVADTDKYIKYLDMQSRFDHYSARNVLLVMAQRPRATQLGEADYWREQGAYVKRSEWKKGILILKPGDEYRREDGSIGQYFNPKKLYDITQTTARRKVRPELKADDRSLITALIYHSPVNIIPVDKQQKGSGAAQYISEEKCIKIVKGLDGPTMYRALAQELAMVEILNYGAVEPEFAAYSTAYILCRKYGIETKDYDFTKIPDSYSKMEPQEIGRELESMQKSAKTINSRMQSILERKISEQEIAR